MPIGDHHSASRHGEKAKSEDEGWSMELRFFTILRPRSFSSVTCTLVHLSNALGGGFDSWIAEISKDKYNPFGEFHKKLLYSLLT